MSINSGGEKIYPEEVEGAVKGHPDVYDCVVVGIPDERWGQRVVAVVQPRDDGAPPTLESIQDHCRTHIAGYKLPREPGLRRRDRPLTEREARLPMGQGSRHHERRNQE